MTKYVEALFEGLEAATAADFARKEIDAVFAELNDQVREGTEGKVGIERRKLEEPEPKAPELEGPLWAKYQAEAIEERRRLEDMITLKPRRTRKTYWAIAAYNPKVGRGQIKELARWSQSDTGYPCKIRWGVPEYICEDREALENTLAELLRDPSVGAKLQQLMQLQPPPAGASAPQQDQSMAPD